MENPPQPDKGQSLESSAPQASQKPSVATEPTSDAPQSELPESPKPKKSALTSIIGKVRESRYLYITVFGFFILVIAAVSVVSIKGSNDKAKPASSASSLTSDNLAALRGATTVVGDPKQILDIQSNAVFEGQILARGELNAAGDVKVGKDLSVAGAGTFGSLQATGNLSVNGNLSIKSGLNITGDSSFGKISASQLTTGTLNLSGDLVITKHLSASGGAPTAASGTVGSGGTVSVSGSDTAGTVTVNTGSGPGAGTLVTVTFSTAFKTTPHVVVTPVGPNAGSLNFYITRTSTGFTIASTNAPAAGVSFSFDYIVIG